jgi:hypothetical protein
MKEARPKKNMNNSISIACRKRIFVYILFVSVFNCINCHNTDQHGHNANQHGINFTIMTGDQYDETLRKHDFTILDQYISKGLVIDKIPGDPRYFVYSNGNTFSINDERSFQLYILSPGEFENTHLKKHVWEAVETLRGLNKYKDGFPGATVSLIRELADSLNLPDLKADKLDMRLMEKADERIEIKDREFRSRFLLHFIATIGEAVLRKYPGTCQWKMSLSDDGETWNPSLEYNKQTVDVIKYTFRNFIERNSATPFADSFDTLLMIIQYNLKH